MWSQSQPRNEASLKPKVVTVIRNGAKPRSNVKILLNRRSVQSYEQLVKDISEVRRGIGFNLKSSEDGWEIGLGSVYVVEFCDGIG